MPTKEATAPENPAPQKTYRLTEKRFRQAEFVRTIWNIVPESGTPYNAVLAPSYWLHNARKMKPSDIIEVFPDDGAFYARLIVVGVGQRGAFVQPLEHVKLTPMDTAALSSKFGVDWLGPFYKHCVVEHGVKEPRKTGFDTPAAASKWLAENLMDLAPAVSKAA